MKIQVEIHLSYESEVLAYGMITLEDLIRFPIQLRKYKNKETGKDLSFVSYPRRERNGKWENVLVPDPILRKEVEKAVGEKIKEEIGKDFYLPEIEVLSICPITPRHPPDARAYICGVASIQVLGLDSEVQHTIKTEKDCCLYVSGNAPSNVQPNYVACENPIVYDEKNPGMAFCCYLQVTHKGGTVSADLDGLKIQEAEEVVFYLTAADGYKKYNQTSRIVEANIMPPFINMIII